MSKLKITGRAKSPRIPVALNKAKIEKIGGGGQGHPLITFQPTHRAVVAQSEMSDKDIEALIEWWQDITEGFGKSPWMGRSGPFIEQEGMGTVIIWTFSGDLDDQDPSIPQYGDDCE